MLCSAGSFLLVIVLGTRRLVIGPEEGGLFTLFAILFFLISVCMVGIGLIGEYMGRTYQVVRNRARYHVSHILENQPMKKPRILFFGYSEVGYTCLDLLIGRGDNVIALITHEDNPDENIWFKTPAIAASGKRHSRLHSGLGEHARMDRPHPINGAGPDPLGVLPEHDLPGDSRSGSSRSLQHARLAAAEIPRPCARSTGRFSMANHASA